MSLLRDTTIEVENPQSREEDEFAEEQRRRQEELSDLLTDGFNAFHYEDSTLNSSATSVEETPHYNKVSNVGNQFNHIADETDKTNLSDVSEILIQNYKGADIHDQLQVLYDVRVREILTLKEEFNNYKHEKAKEFSILKNKTTLAEAEIRHFQVSLSNAESLLVEKTETINKLKKGIASSDEEIGHLKKVIEEMKIEVCAYQSTVNELQLKQVDNNPFNVTSRKLQSEELQKVHHDQVLKLESLLQEETKRSQILAKQNARLEEDIKKLIERKTEADEENNFTLMALSKKLQSSQQQCKDMFILGEALKKEHDHFKERMQQLEMNKLDLSSEDFNIKKMDKDTMFVHMEKLKRMLLDKDIELNSLQAKLKFYDSDLNELFEYRNILSEMYTKDFKSCNNLEHEELLIFMQRQLQSYEQAVEDRNNQILSLTKDKTELQEQIEQRIQETRAELENLSQRYSLPQLEIMSNELKSAEETIAELKSQLLEKQESINKMEGSARNMTEVCEEQDRLKEANNKMQEMIVEYKAAERQLTQDNAKVKSDLQKICSQLGVSDEDLLKMDFIEDNSKLKYQQIHNQLDKIAVYLEHTNVKRNYANIMYQIKEEIGALLKKVFDQKEVENELVKWRKHLDDCFSDFPVDYVDEVQKIKNDNLDLANRLKHCESELENARKEIECSNEKKVALLKEVEDSKQEIKKINDQLNQLNKYLEVVEENKQDLEKQLDNAQKQLSQATLELKKEIRDSGVNTVRKKLFKELNPIQDVPEHETFQKCVQAEVLKAEILLRDQLQEENVKKMNKIEEQYRNVLVEKCELYNKEKEKCQRQETMFRMQFAAALEECGRKIDELEKENVNLLKQTDTLIKEYRKYKNETATNLHKYQQLIVESRRSAEVSNKKWCYLLDYYMAQVTHVEKQSRKNMKSLSKRLTASQREANLIESIYNEKIEKYKSEVKAVPEIK